MSPCTGSVNILSHQIHGMWDTFSETVGHIDIDGMKHFLMSTSGIGYQSLWHSLYKLISSAVMLWLGHYLIGSIL
jgi:hypothetical protein